MSKKTFPNKFKKFLISGSASLYGGGCPTILQHIEIEDKSDLVYDKLKVKEMMTKTILGFDKELHMQYTNIEWEGAIYLVCQYLEKKKDTISFPGLIEYAKNPDMSKESVIFVLAAITLVKNIEGCESIRSKGYATVQEICKSTRDFFLFVQLRKLLSVNCLGLSTGHGFKKTVKNWYESYEPRKLLLELVRSPSAFKWRHKDLLTLCHINPRKLTIDYQVIFSYIFSNAKKTKTKFREVEEAEYILTILEKLTFEEPTPTIEQYLERAQFIKDEFESSSYLDFPPQCYVYDEMWKFVLENASHADILAALCYTNLSLVLARNTLLFPSFCTKINENCDVHLKGQLQMIFATNRCRKTSLDLFTESKLKNTPLDASGSNCLLQIISLLDTLIMKGVNALPKIIDKKVYVFINDIDMLKFKKVNTMESQHNEIRALQAATFIMYSLYCMVLQPGIEAFLFTKGDKLASIQIKTTSNFYEVQGYIKQMIRLKTGTAENTGTTLDALIQNKYSAYIFIYNRLSEADIDEITLNIQKTETSGNNAKIIFVGIEFNPLLRSRHDTSSCSVLVINDFSLGTLPLIKAFINNEL